MTDRPVLAPGPDHPIDVRPAGTHVTVRWGGRVIAESDRALLLTEAGYPAASYVPLSEVDAGVLEPTGHQTYCPYKGVASYYSLRSGDALADNAVWTYVSPHAAVAEIAGHVAFYPDQVEVTVAGNA